MVLDYYSAPYSIADVLDANIQGGGSFATFAYSVIPELGCHLRPMVRKGKSLLFGHISRIFKKNGGGAASTAENGHLPPKFFFTISRRMRQF